ncbi:MAG: organoarsenical effux MFS transporter ArsJ [Paracoccaceae bacterium]|nr:organoarsenical effux MFS transporter ArsJ [Paracoccaceae bacterium]
MGLCLPPGRHCPNGRGVDVTAAARSGALAAYAAVTAAYWAFMLTDGALRMLVLLHFDTLGFSPIQIAWLFLGYEMAGIVTNLSAGWLATRFGLTATLFAGLGIQVVALIALTRLDPGWGVALSVTYVILAQTLSGVAKDLTKMSSKSAVKLLAPAADGGLFRWVAVLTGSKNAVKGAGFFLGAALLALIGFRGSMWAMAITLASILAASVAFMPPGLPRGKKGTKVGEVFAKDRRINQLSLARMFLFGARDVWFVVGVPVYFEAVLSDGTPAGHRTAFFLVGAFMAAWVIAYGGVQAVAPRLLNAKTRQEGEIAALASRWVIGLTVIPFALAALTLFAGAPALWLSLTLAAGLLLFGFVFAVNSSAHSYLILAFTSAERVTMDVGFYYMSNAVGRLLGTLLSGISYQLGGLPLCLATAGLLSGLSWISVRRLGG